MSALLDGHEQDAQAALPFDGECPVCHEPVLVVEIHGRDVVADHAEVMEGAPCPSCASVEAHGHQRHGPWDRSMGRCLRCHDTRIVGEALPAFGVAVDPDGAARFFHGRRFPGEAVHRVHFCPHP